MGAEIARMGLLISARYGALAAIILLLWAAAGADVAAPWLTP